MSRSATRIVVNRGFVGKASHALKMCFGSDGDRYTEECFRLSPKEEPLYDIRNAINHGDIDDENLTFVEVLAQSRGTNFSTRLTPLAKQLFTALYA
jgi:hypothetical protein